MSLIYIFIFLSFIDEVIRKRLLIDGDGAGDDRRINLLLKTFTKWCNSPGTPEEGYVYYTDCSHSALFISLAWERVQIWVQWVVVRKDALVIDSAGPKIREIKCLKWAFNYAVGNIFFIWILVRFTQYQRMLSTLAQCEFSLGKTLMVYDMNLREMENYEKIYTNIGRKWSCFLHNANRIKFYTSQALLFMCTLTMLMFQTAEQNITSAHEKIAECKKEIQKAKRIRKNRQGNSFSFLHLWVIYYLYITLKNVFPSISRNAFFNSQQNTML